MDKESLEKAIEASAKIPMGITRQQCGGVLTKKCRHCGGDVVLKGTGVPFEACSSCGKKHYEPIFGVCS